MLTLCHASHREFCFCLFAVWIAGSMPGNDEVRRTKEKGSGTPADAFDMSRASGHGAHHG
jgi:hypothetical protein